MKKCIRDIKNCRTFAPQKGNNDCFTVLKSNKKMKKLAFVFAAIVAVSFASCGNKTTGTECADSTACDSVVCCDSVACDSVCCDSVACDSVVAE